MFVWVSMLALGTIGALFGHKRGRYTATPPQDREGFNGSRIVGVLFMAIALYNIVVEIFGRK